MSAASNFIISGIVNAPNASVPAIFRPGRVEGVRGVSAPTAGLISFDFGNGIIDLAARHGGRHAPTVATIDFEWELVCIPVPVSTGAERILRFLEDPETIPAIESLSRAVFDGEFKRVSAAVQTIYARHFNSTLSFIHI